MHKQSGEVLIQKANGFPSLSIGCISIYSSSRLPDAFQQAVRGSLLRDQAHFLYIYITQTGRPALCCFQKEEWGGGGCPLREHKRNLCFSSRQETWLRQHLKRSLCGLHTQQNPNKAPGVLHCIQSAFHERALQTHSSVPR